MNGYRMNFSASAPLVSVWKTKLFKTKQAMDKWITAQGHNYQWNEIFVNDAYGVECRRLRVI
jgi:hypothetical protein